MKNLIKAGVIVGVIGGLATFSAPVFGATTSHKPAGGAIWLFATPLSVGPNVTVPGTSTVLTGAIGDYGKSVTTDANRKVDPLGNYTIITLQKGTFMADKTAVNAAAKTLHPTLNAATCSGHGSATGLLKLYDGTGLYKGISGSITFTITEAVVYPRYTTGAHVGQCDSVAAPIGQYVSRSGPGTVSFS